MIETWALKKINRAFENKDVGSIQSLILERCINPNALIPGRGVSLLHLIIGHQSEGFALRITKLFLRVGGDPNVQSSDGVTPIHVAAAWGRNAILHLLLVNGGDPWMQDDEKKNAFNYAFEEKKWSTIELLHRFHQMCSAANCQKEAEPKYERSLERVLLRKGEEVFAFAPDRKSTKSMMTQTQSETSASPIREKIRYFEPEPSRSTEMQCSKEPEKDIRWCKDFYQTSCEVVVHREPSDTPEKEKQTFVSSVHIDTSPGSESAVEKSDQSLTDVRGQLFEELREAVRRRSRLKMVQEEKDPSQEAFIAKEVSYLYGVNFEDNMMLKNMSDFATKVMKEIEVEETDRKSEKTIDLCQSNVDLTGVYLSCEEDARQGSKAESFLVPQQTSNVSSLYLTPIESSLPREEEKKENSNESFVSVAEEYKYSDAEEGVVLLEKKLVVTPTISFCEKSISESDVEENTSTASTIPSGLSCDSDVLRCELNGLGYHPGPITKTTKKLYLRKLWRLKKDGASSPKNSLTSVPRQPLENSLIDVDVFEKIPSFSHLEEEMAKSFETWTKRKWREGTNKTSFNYLLLDPRISLNLPKRAPGMKEHEIWKNFLSGIFYIGKGKRSRPYAHLYKAIGLWEKTSELPTDEKTEKIMEIWREGLGVVCLQVFQNIIPVEALTREAAMIDAVGVAHLNNARAGEYYGVASTWPTRDKVRLGIYLLYKAMLIFVNEGERQIKPYDID